MLSNQCIQINTFEYKNKWYLMTFNGFGTLCTLHTHIKKTSLHGNGFCSQLQILLCSEFAKFVFYSYFLNFLCYFRTILLQALKVCLNVKTSSSRIDVNALEKDTANSRQMFKTVDQLQLYVQQTHKVFVDSSSNYLSICVCCSDGMQWMKLSIGFVIQRNER